MFQVLLRSTYYFRRCSRIALGGFLEVHLVAFLGLEKLLGVLLATPGIEAGATTNDCATALMYAAQAGHVEVVRLLLATPASRRARRMTAARRR